MDQAHVIGARTHIEEAQRCIGNLHAAVTNFLSSGTMEVGGAVASARDIVRYLDEQVRHIQGELKKASAELP